MIFPDVEELDFVGPLEALSSVDEFRGESVEVSIVAKDMGPVKGYNGLRVLPDAFFAEDARYDILVIPGGEGRRKAMRDREVLEFIERQLGDLTYLCSVCTGAFILAEGGWLRGLKATTHHTALDELSGSYTDIEVVKERVVKNHGNPKIWLAAGVTSGIDLSLELIEELFDHDLKVKVADRIEYEIL